MKKLLTIALLAATFSVAAHDNGCPDYRDHLDAIDRQMQRQYEQQRHDSMMQRASELRRNAEAQMREQRQENRDWWNSR